jgi:hypothetical protein
MPLVNGTLTDFGLDPLSLSSPVLIFRASTTGITGLNVLSARKAVEVTPAPNGFFEVELVATSAIAPADVHYTVEIRYRDALGMTVTERLPWQLYVTAEGGALGDLLRVPSNPALVYTGTEPPEPATPGTWWLDPETGDLAEASEAGAWDHKMNLRGPAGYNATDAAQDAQALADFANQTAGPNPFATALQTALRSQSAPQPDYVQLAQQRSPYKRMTVKRTSYSGQADALEISCHADNADRHRVSYLFTGGPNYRIVGDVREHSNEYAMSYSPPSGETDADYGKFDVRIKQGEVTLAGAGWNTAATYYTTAVGATWTAQIVTTEPNARVLMTHYTDNRGGRWTLDLVELPAVSATISTWASVGANKYGVHVLTVPNPGTYTLRGTFAGDDPANPPSGGAGTSRGWLLNATVDLYLARISQPVQGYALLSPGVSNKNFAFTIKNPASGVPEFIPYHGTAVETIVEPPRVYADGALLDVAAMTIDTPLEVESLAVVQHIKGHTSSAPTELVEVWTVDTFAPDGTYKALGTLKVLSPLEAQRAMYTGMLPFNPAVLDLLVTSYRNAYPATAAMGNGSSTSLPLTEGRFLTSIAAVGPNPAHLAAARYNDPVSTRRQLVNANDPAAFIEHRTPTLGKFYPRFGYTDGTAVPAGTVWRFDVDFWFGRIPAIKPLITV